MKKKIILGLAAVIVLIQFIPVERSNPAVEGEIVAPPEVMAVLARACYDCHSNHTEWPWYAYVAPVSWLLARDVSEGRHELNFSTWGAYGAKQKRKKLKETAEEVAEGEMPPWYYALVHAEARLSPGEHEALRAWTAEEIARLAPPATVTAPE